MTYNVFGGTLNLAQSNPDRVQGCCLDRTAITGESFVLRGMSHLNVNCTSQLISLEWNFSEFGQQQLENYRGLRSDRPRIDLDL